MTLKKLFPEMLTIAIILIGTLCYPLVSRGLQYAPPLLFAAFRTSVAGIGIFALLPLFRQPRTPPKSMWKWAILLSVPAVAFTYGTMFLSHENPKMAMLPVLENLQPFFSVFLAIIFLEEKLSSATRMVLIFGAFGLFFLSTQAFIEGSGFDVRSAVFALLASLGAALTSIIAKRLKRPDVIVTLSAWQFMIGGALLLVLSLFFEKSVPVQWNIPFISILVFLAIVGTGMTTIIWYKLIQKTDVARLSVFFFLSPALGLIMANRL